MTTEILKRHLRSDTFNDLCRTRLINFAVLRTDRTIHHDIWGRMRACNWISNPYAWRLTTLHLRSKHEVSRKLLDEVKLYDRSHVSGQSKLREKVSVLVGYDELHDAINDEQPSNCEVDDSCRAPDIAILCKRFPSIVLGNSPTLSLYHDATNCPETNHPLANGSDGDFLPDSVRIQWDDSNGYLGSSSIGFLTESTASEVVLECDVTKLARKPGVCLEGKEDRLEDVDDHSCHVVFHNKESSGTAAVGENMEPKTNPAFLDESISSCLLYLTKKQCLLLENSGFHTLRKLLHHYPRTYADLQNARIGVADGQYMASVGEVISSRGVRAGHSFSFLEVIVSCKVMDDESKQLDDATNTRQKKSIYVHLKKFFRGTRFASQQFLRVIQNNYTVGDVVCVSGKVKTMSSENHYEMTEYSIDVIKMENLSTCAVERPYPIYPSKGRLNPEFVRSVITRAVQALPSGIDPLPEPIIQRFRLLSLHEAYKKIHCPKNMDDADCARKRLIFDEFFYVQLGRLYQMLDGVTTSVEKEGLLYKYSNPESNSLHIEQWSILTRTFFEALPFSLTPSQLGAISEIMWDLKRSAPMNRLLQGDVGCGKTVVAFLACMEVIASGYQAAFMVPTELLAIQHYELLLKMLKSMENDALMPSVVLLTGSASAKESRLIREDLRNGEISMVIGTHSLISEKLEFSNLRIAVIDEQHLFGVIQRGKFSSKLYCNSSSTRISPFKLQESSSIDGYMAPHILAMSATPIPRTLALALYGDMSLTQITDLPAGRIPVETCVVEGNSDGFENVYKMMHEELEIGGRVYLVYPVIEQSELLPQLRAASSDLETISSRFQGYACRLLHGRMKAAEKDDALRSFRTGESQILLATQIIEIGVDIPEASMMVVMNAERFGIAQLHQLRGRVGRGKRKSKCILVGFTATSLDRLKLLERSSNGFDLANLDLVMRGPGDLLGKKQSGHLPDFPIARLEMYGDLLQEARSAALQILGDSHNLETFPHLKAELSMRQPLCVFGD